MENMQDGENSQQQPLPDDNNRNFGGALDRSLSNESSSGDRAKRQMILSRDASVRSQSHHLARETSEERIKSTLDNFTVKEDPSKLT